MIGRDYASTPHNVYSPEEAAFIQAMEEYRRVNRRPFPTCGEVLAVLVEHLGYRKVAEAGPLPRFGQRGGRPCPNSPTP